MSASEATSKPTPFSKEGQPPAEGEVTILVRNLVKRFPGVVALDHVKFDLKRGEVHALLGENGAGKTTFVKILYGIYVPDEGEIYVDGKRVTFTSSLDAIRHGISLVSQIPQIIGSLTIAENIILGLEKYGMMVKIRKVENFIREQSEKIGIKIDPNTEVWKLSYTQKQLVELLRAVLLGARVIMLDEAVTFLPIREKRKFYRFMHDFARQGGSVILITHKIPEAMEAADRITVLRRGKYVGTVTAKEATLDLIRRMMFGARSSEITYKRLPSSKPDDRVMLEAKDLWIMGDYGAFAVKGVKLQVRAGEVLGIAGVAGNGQLELIQAIVGLRKVRKGRILVRVNGDMIDVTNKGVGHIRKLGVGYIPDEPLKYGVSVENNIEENLAILPLIARTIINWRRMRTLAKKIIEEYKVVTPSSKTPVKLLSGGNIMKVLVSRELTVAKKMLVAYNPTRALDEVTAINVRKIIKDKVIKDRIAVIMASEDLDEIFQVSDTIAVMNSGRIVGVFPAEKADRDKIEKLMVM